MHLSYTKKLISLFYLVLLLFSMSCKSHSNLSTISKPTPFPSQAQNPSTTTTHVQHIIKINQQLPAANQLPEKIANYLASKNISTTFRFETHTQPILDQQFITLTTHSTTQNDVFIALSNFLSTEYKKVININSNNSISKNEIRIGY